MLTLIFDGNCRICTRIVQWIATHDLTTAIRSLPNQNPAVLARYGLTPEAVEREVWLLGDDGTRWRGAAAANRVLDALGGFWAALARLYRLRAVRWVEDRLYHWVSVRRYWLSAHAGFLGAPPACLDPKAGCVQRGGGRA